MSEPFLIVGLPRSRTAWWSIATTTPQSVCRHEPLKDCNSFEELAALWTDPKIDYVGVSDSGLVPVLERVLEEIKPRTIIIERPAAEALRSFENYFSGHAYDHDKVRVYFETSARMLRSFHAHSLVKVVGYADLSNPDVVSGAYQWLMPKNEWPFRFDMMHLNVQVDPAYVAREAVKPHSHWYRQP